MTQAKVGEPTKDLSLAPDRYCFPLWDISQPDSPPAKLAYMEAINKARVVDKVVADTVQKILTEVKEEGDVEYDRMMTNFPNLRYEERLREYKQGEKFLKYVEQFDGTQFDGNRRSNFKVKPSRIATAPEKLSPELWDALKLAKERIWSYYYDQLLQSGKDTSKVDNAGVVIQTRSIPIDSVGIYVPGGGGIYPSSVLMNAIPARVAGVKDICICSPPNKETGEISPEVLAAANLLGIDDVYEIGGVQAIAAMAYPSVEPSIHSVDMICGPGNDYVAQALKIVSNRGEVKIPDAYAGPSEIAIICDGSANFSYLALDILAQIEHGSGSMAYVISWEEEALDKLNQAINDLLSKSGSRLPKSVQAPITIYSILESDEKHTLEMINNLAPEHLQIVCADAPKLANGVRNAGAIFCGDDIPTALGDYMAGPSHTLPTARTARHAGVLRIADFQKTINIISRDKSTSNDKGNNKEGDPAPPSNWTIVPPAKAYEDATYEEIVEAAAVIAEAEGFSFHAKSLRARIETRIEK